MTSVKSTDLTTTTVEPTESMGTSTETSPPASNTSTVTEATTEPVFPAQPSMTPFPVVRVFGTATKESQPLPADGVCDYTFYDGLCDTGPFDTLYSPNFSAPVEHVLSHASLHSVTEYGFSFAYRNASQVARDLEIPEDPYTRVACDIRKQLTAMKKEEKKRPRMATALSGGAEKVVARRFGKSEDIRQPLDHEAATPASFGNLAARDAALAKAEARPKARQVAAPHRPWESCRLRAAIFYPRNA
ncbi:hypothetical protein MRX96_032572 [Rhipicephalus microplus]